MGLKDSSTTVEFKFTPEEVENILKDFVQKETGVKIEKVRFNVGKVYHSDHDQYGTDTLKEIICEGTTKGINIPK